MKNVFSAIKQLLFGRTWTTLLGTTDESRAYALTQKLAAAGIPFRNEQLDERSFSLNTLAVGRADGKSELVQGIRHMTDPGPEDGAARKTTYLVRVQLRSLDQVQHLAR